MLHFYFKIFFILIIFNIWYNKITFAFDGFIQGKTCVTPDNIFGNCIPMEFCDRITFLLKTWRNQPVPSYVTNYIRKSHCGSTNNIHFGCCAPQDIRLDYGASMPSAPPSVYPHSYLPVNSNMNIPTYQYNFQQAAPLTSAWFNYGERQLDSMPCGGHSGDRISNGEVVRLSEFPWMALLDYEVGHSRRSFLCGGTLITDRFVLTAAHCVSGQYELVGVRLGEYNLDSEEDCEDRYVQYNHIDTYCAPNYVDIGIALTLKHPQYNHMNIQNDVALIKLASSVQFQDNIKPICLPRAGYVSNVMPESFIISGWGITERGYTSNVLKKALVPLRTPDVCENIFRRSGIMAADKICVGGYRRRSTCRGDSGGPVFEKVSYGSHIRYVQFGVISAGEQSCGSKHNLPGVHTNIIVHMPWIVSQLQP